MSRTAQTMCYTATRIAASEMPTDRARQTHPKPLTSRVSFTPHRLHAMLGERLQRVCKPCAGVPHAWQVRRFALPLHPSRPSVDTSGPSERLCLSTPPRASPLAPTKEPSCPLEPGPRRFAHGARRGAIAPLRPLARTFVSRHPRPELAHSGRRAGGLHAPAP